MMAPVGVGQATTTGPALVAAAEPAAPGFRAFFAAASGIASSASVAAATGAGTGHAPPLLNTPQQMMPGARPVQAALQPMTLVMDPGPSASKPGAITARTIISVDGGAPVVASVATQAPDQPSGPPSLDPKATVEQPGAPTGLAVSGGSSPSRVAYSGHSHAPASQSNGDRETVPDQTGETSTRLDTGIVAMAPQAPLPTVGAGASLPPPSKDTPRRADAASASSVAGADAELGGTPAAASRLLSQPTGIPPQLANVTAAPQAPARGPSIGRSPPITAASTVPTMSLEPATAAVPVPSDRAQAAPAPSVAPASMPASLSPAISSPAISSPAGTSTAPLIPLSSPKAVMRPLAPPPSLAVPPRAVGLRETRPPSLREPLHTEAIQVAALPQAWQGQMQQLRLTDSFEGAPTRTSSSAAIEMPVSPTIDIAVTSARLGDVRIGIDGTAGDLRVSIGLSSSSAAIVAADSPRLIADLATSGVRVQALDVSGGGSQGGGFEGNSFQNSGFQSGGGQPSSRGQPNAPILPALGERGEPSSAPVPPPASDRYA